MMRIYNTKENQVVEAVANYLKWAPERKDVDGRKKMTIPTLNDGTFLLSSPEMKA
jgi:hypothetical protein